MKRPSSSEPLEEQVMEYLRRGGREVSYEPGRVIISRGDPGRAFFVVLSGMVEVVQAGEGGLRLSLARTGEGAFFGEMALLTGEPVSADVVAAGPVVLLEYPAALFPAALAECEPLRRRIMAGLAAKLRATSADMWSFFQRAKVLNVLVEGAGHAGPLVAKSPRMAKVQAAIGTLAAGTAPLLISGEVGSGKGYLAAKIHQAGASPDSPFLAVDCAALGAEDPARFLFGSLEGLREGQVPAPDSLQAYGVLHLANGGTLLLRNVEGLDGPCQEVLAAYLAGVAAGGITYPVARVVGTSAVDLSARAAAGTFRADLAALLTANVVALPRLAERRQDILPLARHFLAEQERGASLRLSTSAEHALVSLRYGHRNVLELREAIQMAAIVADGDEIRGEHIFSGPKDEGAPSDYNLLELAWVRRLVTPGVHRALRVAVLAFFAAVVVTCAAGGRSPLGYAANTLVWGFWWPALMVAFLLVGRVWCSLCPLSTTAGGVRKIKGFEVAPPAWLKNRSGWLIMAGFLVIIWVEHLFRMNENPVATAVFLGSLAAVAAVAAVVFQREVWCRYLCPLGNIGAVYSLPAAINVRANPSVCATYCTTHECFKGSATQSGCPVFLHPLYARESHHCKLCFGCLNVCPHGSARLYLRVPLKTIWRQADMESALVPFALFVFFVSLFMLASRSLGWASTVPGFALMTLGAVALTVAMGRALPRLLSHDPDPDPAVASRVSFSLLILAWGPAMAFHLADNPWLRSLHLGPVPGTFAASLVPAAGVPLLALGQALSVIIAGLATGIILWRLKARLAHQGVAIRAAGWGSVQVLAGAYLVAALGLTGPW